MAQFNNDIIVNMHKVPKDVDVIVGIPRSGLMVASILALYLNKPFVDVDGFFENKMFNVGNTKNTRSLINNCKEAKKIIVVDDSINSGRAMEEVRERFKGYSNIIFMAIYATKESVSKVDIYFSILDNPRMFEWNFMHHIYLEHACMDIDGVLCVDPTDEENDDGEKYKEFLLNAMPKYIPTRTVGWLVTSRLEKYRNETEIWLKKWGISYKHLIMLNLKSAEKRKELNCHASFKADFFRKEPKAYLFIESEKAQAEVIAKISGKDVVCVDTMNMYKGTMMFQIRETFKNYVKIILKQVLPRTWYNCIKKYYKK